MTSSAAFSGRRKTAVVIQHVLFEGPGILFDLLRRERYETVLLDAAVDDLRSALVLDCDLLVVMGGPIGVHQVVDYPFLVGELQSLEKRLGQSRPMLGICLGAQLVAVALGSRVYKGFQSEIGWGPIQVANVPDNVLAPLASKGAAALHWHGDTFDLPVGATRLASSEVYENQAFAFGKSVLALQFHIEVTASDFERWMIGHRNEILGLPDGTMTRLRGQAMNCIEGMNAAGEATFSRWLAEI